MSPGSLGGLHRPFCVISSSEGNIIAVRSSPNTHPVSIPVAYLHICTGTLPVVRASVPEDALHANFEMCQMQGAALACFSQAASAPTLILPCHMDQDCQEACLQSTLLCPKHVTCNRLRAWWPKTTCFGPVYTCAHGCPGVPGQLRQSLPFSVLFVDRASAASEINQM